MKLKVYWLLSDDMVRSASPFLQGLYGFNLAWSIPTKVINIGEGVQETTLSIFGGSEHLRSTCDHYWLTSELDGRTEYRYCSA